MQRAVRAETHKPMAKEPAPPLTAPGATDIRRVDRPLRGIGLVVIATLFFSLIDASGKYLLSIGQLPATQVVWVRFLGQLLAIVAMLGVVSMPRLLKTKRLGLQLVRSTLLLSSTAFNFLALKYLRLDQTATIQFLAPLTVALMSGPLLGEWVGWRRMVAILVGFGGIIVAVRPGAEAFEPAFILAFLCMLSYAFFIVVTRFLSGQDSSETTLFYSLFAGTYFVAPFAIVDWVWPQDKLTLVVMCLIGIFGAIGHYLFIVAYRFAPASTLAPFVYLSLITHAFFGFIIFGHVPDQFTLIGAAIVIGSGLYILHRERVLNREKMQAALTAAPSRESQLKR